MTTSSDPTRRPSSLPAAGVVTRLGMPPTTGPPAVEGQPPSTARSDRRTLLWFGAGAVAVAVIGLVVVLVVTLTGDPDPIWSRGAAGRPDTRPTLARLCPPPTAVPGAGTGVPAPASPATPTGARTVDSEAGISYRAYDSPWLPWNSVWTKGTLQVPYKVGQHFVTEVYAGGTYHASILSAAVPVADNDAVVFDLACVGRQVAADVRAEYYPQPNEMELLTDAEQVLGGRSAWVTKFRLHFSEEGLRATDELAAVALIDVGRPQAAILYVSIPGTHRQFDWVVDDVLASVRPL